MQFRRQSRDEDSINLTPLIDVVFLLLIFFMVSTTFTKETHLELDLPEAVGAPAPEVSEPLEIIISAEGGYAINGQALVNNQSATLSAALSEVSGGDTEQRIIITADAKAAHENVVRAMDTAGQLGFSNLSLTTRRPEGSAE
ncbi:biopolymer transporter ExbD [Gilvimarinus agarilyticus]|uniref:ExbD/TolR family protein n=1 Tax=unclassified Gilvimarinus TaxID=2642066 RepID=UPI001C091F0B|nr:MULTISPECIES: biopolymer transporter ExbD [unclassified Gilvimarinus]MBU2887425.1 biopolymer transporter ExbD [Gilvimarinus agarilyticus]MDO6572084.1 biopolymer transporter ExbD [Gilvimarinus sp. 2_MG-2023]MDO6746145.1 biopolymer transporter ExbD [Gilvimarinus sp. 1_MG-2023]